jgi:hypothetical protein
MNKKVSEGRRNFLKTSAISAAGMALVGPMANKAKAAPITTALVDLSTTPINQDIDNLHVAYITDATMLRNNVWGSFNNFNNPNNTTTGVVYKQVEDNMDKLACALANKTNPVDPSAAWATIFKIPATKTWATAKAALKVNCFSGLFPCVLIVAKIAKVLVSLGMPAANIRILDGGAGTYNNGAFVGSGYLIPTGVTFDTTATGDTLTFPDNSTANVPLALSQVDIIVNIAVNKGHDQYGVYSGVTMSLKNHIWTFNNQNHVGGLATLTRNNKCDHLLGKIPASYPAKQQLCIVDSLWCGDQGPLGWQGHVTDGNNTNSIAMSTFAGAVDYVSTMKIRSLKFHAGTDVNSGWNQTLVDRFITDFGYAAAAKTTVMTPVTGAGQGLYDAGPIILPTTQDILPRENPNITREGYVQFSVSGNGIKTQSRNLYLAKGETVQSAEIFTVQGRKVRTLALNSGSNHIVWDGRMNSGSFAQSGNYIVRIKGQKTMTSGDLVLSR